jgi:hypothetical protein
MANKKNAKKKNSKEIKETKRINRKALRKEASDYVVTYNKIQDRIASLDDKKKTLRKKIESIFDKLEIDSIEVSLDDSSTGEAIKAQRYDSQRISYDIDKLMPVLKKKKLRKKVIKFVVDSDALEDAYNAGLISIQQIEPASKVSTSTAFKVQRIKQ